MIPIKSTFFSIAAAVTSVALATTSLAAEEAVLRGVSCFPIGSPPSVPFEAVIDEINKRGKGVVQIKLLGGAPAIGSPFQVGERMALGAYDFAGCPESFFGNLLPEGPALRLTDYTFAELRENGGLDYFQGLMKAKGAYYVGRHHDDGEFHLYLKTKIDKPDLTGLNLRISPVYTAFFKELGASVQRSSMPEIYTLMENGTIDGFGWSLRGMSPTWQKVTEYRVEPGIYHATIHTIANLKKWESLSEEARDVINEVVLEAEARLEPTSDHSIGLNTAVRATQKEQGFKTIAFEGAEAELWVNTANEAAWAEFLEQNPKHGPKLKELFTKAD